MSAFIVSDDVISSVVLLVDTCNPIPNELRQSLGESLLHLNEQSVCHRYSEPYRELWKEYRFCMPQGKSLAELVKAAKCWQYQACELPNCEDYYCWQMVQEALDSLPLETITASEEYKNAKWGE